MPYKNKGQNNKWVSTNIRELKFITLITILYGQQKRRRKELIPKMEEDIK